MFLHFSSSFVRFSHTKVNYWGGSNSPSARPPPPTALPNLPLQLDYNASPVGIGAVLSHVMPDDTERPIALASRPLSKAERNYAQIDKEALATVWGVKNAASHSRTGQTRNTERSSATEGP